MSKGRKTTPAKIIETELKRLGEIVYNETRATVRISKDTFDSEGNQINEGGSLRDSVNYFPKGKKLTMSQLDYGKWQKPKELGSTKWNPPIDRNSPQWDNPLMDSIKKNLPNSINVIAKDLIKTIIPK